MPLWVILRILNLAVGALLMLNTLIDELFLFEVFDFLKNL